MVITINFLSKSAQPSPGFFVTVREFLLYGEQYVPQKVRQEKLQGLMIIERPVRLDILQRLPVEQEKLFIFDRETAAGMLYRHFDDFGKPFIV